MVTVCRGVAAWELWMIRLEGPIEVMVGTVSTLTEDEEQTQTAALVVETHHKC